MSVSLQIGREDFGNSNAEIVVEHEHFAAGNQPAVHEYVDGIACQFIEGDHRPFAKLEDILDQQLSPSQLYPQIEFDVFQSGNGE